MVSPVLGLSDFGGGWAVCRFGSMREWLNGIQLAKMWLAVNREPVQRMSKRQ